MRKIAFLKSALIFRLFSFALIPVIVFVLACESSFAEGYKPSEPRLDESGAPAQSKTISPGATLQGGVRKVDKAQSRKGRIITGARRGQSDLLKGKAGDSGPLQAQAESSIGIIGVKFVSTVGRPPVINEVFPNTPADKIGLRVSDIIVAVDGVPTVGLSREEVFDLIVGTPGTQVSLSILRNGDYSAVSCTRMDINELLDPRVRRDYMIHM